MAEILTLNPMQIKVREGLDRYRQDPGALADLANSIKTFGQIQPVLVTKELELVAGGRRLAACMLAGIEVKAWYSADLDDLQLREIELEENIQRKAFTPAEEVLAIDNLHKLKQSIHGVAHQGVKGGWTLEHTAAAIGKTKGTVIEAQKLAEAIKHFPSLAECKDKNSIKKAIRQLETVVKRADATKLVEQQRTDGKQTFNLVLQDGLEFMSGLEDGSVDLVLTDPPYGIDYFDQVQAGETQGFTYEDTVENAFKLYAKLATESFRFTKSTAHLVAFCSLDHFQELRKLFIAAGWDCHIKPYIWIKSNAGSCNWPSRYPKNCYEVALFARKADSVILKQGYPDWMQFEAVLGNDRVHPTQKPIALLRELISRFTMPGSVIADPFAGSGSTLLAALEENCLATGSELEPAAYNAACQNYQRWFEKREAKK